MCAQETIDSGCVEANILIIKVLAEKVETEDSICEGFLSGSRNWLYRQRMMSRGWSVIFYKPKKTLLVKQQSCIHIGTFLYIQLCFYLTLAI